MLKPVRRNQDLNLKSSSIYSLVHQSTVETQSSRHRMQVGKDLCNFGTYFEYMYKEEGKYIISLLNTKVVSWSLQLHS